MVYFQGTVHVLFVEDLVLGEDEDIIDHDEPIQFVSTGISDEMLEQYQGIAQSKRHY